MILFTIKRSPSIKFGSMEGPETIVGVNNSQRIIATKANAISNALVHSHASLFSQLTCGLSSKECSSISAPLLSLGPDLDYLFVFVVKERGLFAQAPSR